MKWFEARCNRHFRVVHSSNCCTALLMPGVTPSVVSPCKISHHTNVNGDRQFTLSYSSYVNDFTTFWFGNPFKSYRKVLYICAVRIFCAVRKYNDTKQREVEEQYTWWPERRKTPMVHQTSCCLTPWFLVIDIRVITVHYCNCNPT